MTNYFPGHVTLCFGSSVHIVHEDVRGALTGNKDLTPNLNSRLHLNAFTLQFALLLFDNHFGLLNERSLIKNGNLPLTIKSAVQHFFFFFKPT